MRGEAYNDGDLYEVRGTDERGRRVALLFSNATQNHVQKDLLDLLWVGNVVGVVPAIKPIAHSEDAIDDEPGLAADELALLLAAADQFDETRIVARHHGDELVLALAGERIEFVEE